MAADANRLAAALAYEDERKRRLAETIPALTGPTTAPRRSVRTDLENLSAGLGQGITTQLEGIKGLITDPVGTAKGAYEAARAVVRDPSVLAAALSQMGQKAMSGPLGAGEVIGEMIGPRKTGPVMAELDVYHGTPHRFPATEANPLGEFDASKIGTGEGAQAYGHGIYYAESPDVAKGYRERLSGTNPNVFRLGENEFSIVGGSPEVKKFVSAAKQKGFSTESAALAYQTLRQFDGNLNAASGELGWRDIPGPFDEEAANLLRAVQFKPEGGAVYKADLPDEMIDRMLDWDKPLSEQRELATPILKELGYLRPNDNGPRQFSQAVKALALEHGGFGESGATGMGLFNAIYKGLQQGKPQAINLAKRMNLNEQEMFMEASPLASEVMKRMGIPGIKYLDAGSRGQGGSGTRNFVVFPGEEKKVRILERDGQKAPPQKIARALESAPRKPEMAFDAPEVKPGDIVDGLKVRPEVANVGSIKASLDNYTVLPGIRSVSIADFGEAGPLTGNVEKLDRRTRNLADQITESKEITPLIVVYSGSQNYILEGSHRIDALDALGKKRIPVIAVIDEDDPPKFMRQKR